MDIVVILFAFLRPVFFVTVPISFAGLNILQLAAIGLLAFLGLALVVHMTLRRRVSLSELDITILLYAIWCIVGWLAYPEKTVVSELVKWIFPLLGFFVLKNLIVTKQHYQRALLAMLLGYSVPIVGSAILILAGQGLDVINYWTQLARYQGVFSNSHNFGHAMVFYIMALVLFVHLLHNDDAVREKNVNKFWLAVLFLLVPIAFYCLYKSLVRTTYIGLFVFFTVYLYQVNRRLLILLSVVGGIAVVLAAPLVALIFFDVVEVMEGEQSFEKIGSGRPFFWKHNINEFLGLPLNRQLVGVGIGNEVPMATLAKGDSFWDSHNDFLEVLIQTGVIGLSLFLIIQILLWIQIIRLPTAVRPPFIALICSVTVMNVLSNSYVSRFGIAQLFYLVLVYIELRPVRARREGSEKVTIQDGLKVERYERDGPSG